MEKLSKLPGIFISGNKSVDELHVKHELEKKKKLYDTVNLSLLPDHGERIKNQIVELEDILKTLTLDSKNGNEESSLSVSSQAVSEKGSITEKSSLENSKTKTDNKCKESSKEYLSFSDLVPKQVANDTRNENMNSPSFKGYRDPKNVIRKTLLTEAKPLVEEKTFKSANCHFTTNLLETNEECVKKMHHSLVTYPDDLKEESDPENLRSSLMMHQKRGLAWMLWRELQDPSGGILADDMGLGKTLTMISLILKQKEARNYFSFKEDEYEGRGTLIVCVASIIHQWGEEITKHCEHKALNVYLYHGPKRDKSAKKMLTYDVVLTTYNVVMAEHKAMNDNAFTSPLFKLKWERIILDEAHTIKNHNSQTAQAIFSLRAFRRWAVTGTPIHNVFKDVYSLLKFLRFSPFDDYKKFKKLTDDKSQSNEERRSLLVKSVILRRTKEQVDEWGKPLIEMKKKSIRICKVELSAEERQIYEKLNAKVTSKFNMFIEKSSKYRSSSLLVLLLRLQQCCSHLCLLKDEVEHPDDSTDIANIMSSLTIDEASSKDLNSSENSFNLTLSDFTTSVLTDRSVKSSKLKELFHKLHEICDASGSKDKCVIVSQWVSMLEIVAHHLKEEDMPYHMIAGATKAEDRQKFADDFNSNENGAKIMLLSLKAGGVGLNLIGANHLFLLDLHWNPALERQACDRIHRVGQSKDVTIYKFICKNTIEEKIKALQEAKSGIASKALRGVKHNTTGLTIEDFKILFNVKK